MKTPSLFQNPISVLKSVNPSQEIHWHENIEIITVLNGLLNLQIGFEKFILNEGDIMIVNSLESHSFTSLKHNTEVLHITFDRETCLKINPFFYESIAIVDYSVGFAQLQENRDKLTDSIVALLKCLPRENPAGGIDRVRLQIIHEKMTDLLNMFSNVYKPRVIKNKVLTVAPEEKINMLYRMISYLYKNYNKAPNLDDFLKKEHYSLYYMSHVIVEITGTSFRDWLTYVRVEEAEKLLLASDTPISAVAHEVGFSSARYLNSNFKKWYGLTPADFRRLHKNIYNEGLMSQGSEVSEARGFLWDYFGNREPGYGNFLAEEDKNTIRVNIMEQGNNQAWTAYPSQECLVNFNELSNPRRWEHLAWVKKSVGFSMLRILVPSDSPVNRNPEREMEIIKHLSAQVKKNNMEFPELKDVKISVETVNPLEKEPFNDYGGKGQHYELGSKNIHLGMLVTVEGRKTPEFFFHSILSKFKKIENVNLVGDCITARDREGGRVLVFILHREAFTLENKMEDFKVIINDIYGEYKLATYKCDLDFFQNDMPIKNFNVLAYLSSDDYASLNKMYGPRVTFELVSFQGNGELRTSLIGNSCCLLELTSVNK